jgi:hypothetical protein
MHLMKWMRPDDRRAQDLRLPAAKAAARHPDSVCSRPHPPLAIKSGWRQHPDRLNTGGLAETDKKVAWRFRKNALSIQFSGMPRRMV